MTILCCHLPVVVGFVSSMLLAPPTAKLILLLLPPLMLSLSLLPTLTSTLHLLLLLLRPLSLPFLPHPCHCRSFARIIMLTPQFIFSPWLHTMSPFAWRAWPGIVIHLRVTLSGYTLHYLSKVPRYLLW